MGGGRRRKYNIWIAYADLFTNLSTFLFISALGAFAVFGSGPRAPGPGVGFERCSMPDPIRQNLIGSGSLLRQIGVGVRPKGAGSGCTEYYGTPDLEYYPAGRFVSRRTPGAVPDADYLGAGICAPVWFSSNLEVFRLNRSRIRFLSLADGSRRNYTPMACGRSRRNISAPSFFPQNASPVDVIFHCLRETGNISYLCRTVRTCVNDTQDSDPHMNSSCQSIRNIHQQAKSAGDACDRERAEARAKALYDICDDAIGSRFQDGGFAAPGMVRNATHSNVRRAHWTEGVDYDSMSISRFNLSLPEGHPARSLSRDTIVLEVRYGG